jgi:thiamine pyrophosphokinase
VSSQCVVVVAGGGRPDAAAARALPRDAPVVAADSGVDTALALGLGIDVVVGDLDSISAVGLAAVERVGARVLRHPVAKDATDLALAIAEADRLLGGARADVRGTIVVLGGDGGRLDHLLAGALALADPAWAHLVVRAHLGPATVHVLHGPTRRDIEAKAGDLLTLVPVGGPAAGIRTDGLRFPLVGETLTPGTTRGVSNVIDTTPASVALEAGTLLAVLPGPEPPGDHL